MMELEYNNGRLEVRYTIKDREIVMTPDEVIAHINTNSEINDRVSFVVPFSVYPQARDIARRIDKAIEYKGVRRRF